MGVTERLDADLAERGDKRAERAALGQRPDGADDCGPLLDLAQEEALGRRGAVERVEHDEQARGAAPAGEVVERLDDGGLALVDGAEQLLDLGPVVLVAGAGAKRRRYAGEG